MQLGNSTKYLLIVLLAGMMSLTNNLYATSKSELVNKSGPLLKNLVVNTDADGDGVSDSKDACPNTPKIIKKVDLNGCQIVQKISKEQINVDPSRDDDGDGVSNASDWCDGLPGNRYSSGCPDTDGDMVFDDVDVCINERGSMIAVPVQIIGCSPDGDYDHDGVDNAHDECVDRPGPIVNSGCPNINNDTDADGVLLARDRCPNRAGPAEQNGCPDSDGDGLSNDVDMCDYLPGSEDDDGCPDSDRDGVTSALDQCPDEAGTAENKGCP